MQSDDAIAALMDEMRAQQGYDAPPGPKMSESQKVAAKSSSSPAASHLNSSYKRLLPELDSYPDEEHLAGNQSIWNAYIGVAPHEPSLSSTGSGNQSNNNNNNNNNNDITYDLPTNPQVEVVRRRAFEKFKQECTEVLQQIQDKWGIKLPIPSMLEKWHMDAKLVEWQKRKQGEIEGGNSKRSSAELLFADGDDLPLMASTEDIYRFAIAVTQKHSTSYFREPILLSKTSSSLFRSTLEPEVRKAWAAKLSAHTSTTNSIKVSSPLPPKFTKKAEQVQKALYRCICQALEHFQQQLSQAVKLENQQTQVQHYKKRRKLPKITRDEEMDQYRVTHAGISLKVHAAYFEKLQRLYDRAQIAAHSQEEFVFEEALFCLLCRYDMLQGAGLQAGVPGRVMDTLLKHFDCRMECFASPLNCRYERFASAFDVDRAFGSRGSFFELNDEFFASGGFFQANPPFCEGVIDAMNRRIHDLLKATTGITTTKPLSFAVFVPAWKDSKAYQDLLENSCLVKHLLLPNGKHFYAEGTQHRRKGSFRPASFDTSILFYQNAAGKSQCPIPDVALDDLRGAFCDDPGSMEKASNGIKRKHTTSSTLQQSKSKSKKRK